MILSKIFLLYLIQIKIGNWIHISNLLIQNYNYIYMKIVNNKWVNLKNNFIIKSIIHLKFKIKKF